MSPEAATQMQIERYRQMTGEERMKIGCELTDAWLDGLRRQIHLEFPIASPDEFRAILRERIEQDKDPEPPSALCLTPP